MGNIYTTPTEPDSGGLSEADTGLIYDASSAAVQEFTMTQLRAMMNAELPLAITAGATTLTVTSAAHAGRLIRLNNTAPIAVTLPQATGTGNTYKFVIGVAATGTSSTIKVANATDVMQGYVFAVTTTSDVAEGFKTSATSDTISINGTTQGGVPGDMIEIQDIATGFFLVRVTSAPTGTEATPFSASVS